MKVRDLRTSGKQAFAAGLHALGVDRVLLHLRRREPLVLRYHRVYPDGTQPFYELGIERSLFEAQLEFLSRNFRVVPLEAILDAVRTRQPLPERAVAITFDDGYRDNLTEAWPALRARNLPATLFVAVENVDRGRGLWWDRLAAAVQAAPAGASTAEVGLDFDPPVVLGARDTRMAVFQGVKEQVKMRPWDEVLRCLDRLEAAWGDGASGREMLSWDELATLAREGCGIGSHTLDHPILSRLDMAEARRQIVESRTRLEERLGLRVRYFSYPNGKRDDVTPEVVALVRGAGYEGAVSTIDGRVGPRSDPFFLERKGATRGASAGPDGRFDEALFAVELSGLLDGLLQRRRRDRSIC